MRRRLGFLDRSLLQQRQYRERRQQPLANRRLGEFRRRLSGWSGNKWSASLEEFRRQNRVLYRFGYREQVHGKSQKNDRPSPYFHFSPFMTPGNVRLEVRAEDKMLRFRWLQREGVN